mmetsp:Transcript_20431/g.33845  ORF Transcript_20431/g.33845 Transcript_20431/m.33845 type:complete len:134 (-) Transcript_20431:141-542(-)
MDLICLSSYLLSQVFAEDDAGDQQRGQGPLMYNDKIAYTSLNSPALHASVMVYKQEFREKLVRDFHSGNRTSTIASKEDDDFSRFLDDSSVECEYYDDEHRGLVVEYSEPGIYQICNLSFVANDGTRVHDQQR